MCEDAGLQKKTNHCHTRNSFVWSWCFRKYHPRAHWTPFLRGFAAIRTIHYPAISSNIQDLIINTGMEYQVRSCLACPICSVSSNSPVNLPMLPVTLNVGSLSRCTINFSYSTPLTHCPKLQCTEPEMPEVSKDNVKALFSDFWLTIIYL